MPKYAPIPLLSPRSKRGLARLFLRQMATANGEKAKARPESTIWSITDVLPKNPIPLRIRCFVQFFLSHEKWVAKK